MSDDRKIIDLIEPWSGQGADVGLVGVPYDGGVIANNGRPGAKDGPRVIREALRRFGPTYSINLERDISHLRIVDCGNVDVIADDATATHDMASEAITALLEKGITPIVLGGGNDISFASIRSLTQKYGSIGGVNVDAHLDVREVVDGVITSGTPYRRGLEELGSLFDGKRFVELGIGESNSKAHYEYAIKKGATVVTVQRMREQGIAATLQKTLQTIGPHAFFSIDIDSVGQAYAPGCSAPAPVGLTPEEITAMAYEAGRASNVNLFEIMEVSPSYDIDGRTARLAAALIYYFLLGYSFRTSV